MWTNEMMGAGVVGGAGFLNSPGNFGTQTGSSPKKEKTAKSDNVVPCTVAQLHQATGEKVMVGSLVVNNVSLLGMVRSVEEQATRITFQLDDMTGQPIEVQLWHGDGEEKTMGDLRSRIVESGYVRVVGNMRTIKDKKLVLAYKVTPISKLDEITMHILEVIHTGMSIHLMDKKIARSEAQGGTSNFSLNQPGMAAKPLQPYAGNESSENISMHGLNPQQKMVFKVILDSIQEEGVHLDQLCEAIDSIPRSTIRSVLEFLSNEGHIYTTIDDNHYKATDCI